MPHFAKLVATLLLLAGPASAEDAPRPDLVFLLIGQSNMAGRAPLAEEEGKPIDGVLLLDRDNEWEPARNPLNRYSTHRKRIGMQRLGPGDGFARRLHEKLPGQTVGLIVNARGGTSIEQWGADQPLYVSSLKRVRALDGVKLAGVLWHQGEANAKDPEYLEKLVDLVKRLRKDLGQPELPFVAGQVAGDRPVNARMAGLPERLKQTAVVSSAGLKVFDGVHFDRDSQKTLGRRYAEAWLTLVKREAED